MKLSIYFVILPILILGSFYFKILSAKSAENNDTDEIENRLEKNRADREVFDSQFLDLQKNYAELTQQLNDAKSQLEKTQNDLAEIKAEREKMIAKIKDLQNQRRDLS